MEHKEKISKSLTGNPKIVGKIPWNKGIPNFKRRGSNHHNWKGGVTSEHERLRKSLEYRLWRTAVYERDSYTCIWCGDRRGHNLNADHIKPWCDYPELRFAIDNGRTLCIDCHKKTPSYLNSMGRNKYTQRSFGR